TKINIEDTSEIQSKCLPASATDIYASHDAIYAFGYGYYSGMKIHKFAISEDLDYRGSIKLNGSIPCVEKPYCFGENDGYLRVLYSEYSTSSSSSSSSSSGSSSSTSSSSSGGATPHRLVLIGESA